MDMWSVGCVVYELFTGNILFPGRTNNEMVKLMMDVKGPFTKKMLRRCAFADKHFDLNEPNAPFIYMEEDTLTKKPVRWAVGFVLTALFAWSDIWITSHRYLT
jgi:serine/threonine-protein kinase PRP4